MALLLASCYAIAAEESNDRPVVEYPASSKFVVLELRWTGPATIDPEQGPFVRIHGDGRVLVRRPPHHREPGDFAAYLSPSDVQTLLTHCADMGLMSFDRKVVEQEQEAAAAKYRQRTGLRPGITDAGTTTLRIHLEGYKPAVGGEVSEDFEQVASWHALSEVVTWYPEIKALSRFQQVVETLQLIRDATMEASKNGESCPRRWKTEANDAIAYFSPFFRWLWSRRLCQLARSCSPRMFERRLPTRFPTLLDTTEPAPVCRNSRGLLAGRKRSQQSCSLATTW